MKIYKVFLMVMVVIAISCTQTEIEKPEPEVKKVLTDKDKITSQLSSWDGSHSIFVRMVKDDMNDPKSFEHVKTDAFLLTGSVLEEYGSRAYGLAMDFRGKNSFGGVVKNTAYAIAEIDTGDIIYLEYEQ